MSMIAWIILGVIAGFIASEIVNRGGEDVVIGIPVGIIGAIVAGWLSGVFGMPGVSGLNLYSASVAVIGALVVLSLYHTLFRSHRARHI